MRLTKVTSALIAAGIGAGLATGYTHFDASSVGAAQAATQPQPRCAVAAAVPATPAAANLPDFTALVDRAGASVVNISTFHATGKGRSTSRISTRTARITNSSSASAAFRTAGHASRSNSLRAAWARASS